MKEYLKLFVLKIFVGFRNLVEFIKDVFFYYRNLNFLKIDAFLLISYIFYNPFRISKNYLLKKGEKEVHVYGETPLTSLETILKTCEITPNDIFYELGCGRGRTCFWVHTFIKCRVIGIEFVPEFVKRANQIVNKFHLKNIEFRHEDMLNSNFLDGTFFYLYGTCLQKTSILKLIEMFNKLPSGTKIVTTSYPLTDYSNEFEVMKRFSTQFTWGMGDVYLNIKT